MAIQCCTRPASHGSGLTLLVGAPMQEHEYRLTLSGHPRQVVARRLRCIGMYVGGALRTRRTHDERAEHNPEDGSHAVAILDHVLCAASHPTGVALIDEGGRVNAFLRVVQLETADGITFHACFCFAAEDLYQETDIRTLYDDDRESYAKIRVARDYTPEPRDPRGPPDFSDSDIASLPDQVWAAFTAADLATALIYGGVSDYG